MYKRKEQMNLYTNITKKCDTGYKSFVYTVTPTNVITIVELRCPVCGEIIDVSSYDKE